MNCSIQCPQSCQEGRCHITKGTCLGCKPGYKAHECHQGSYFSFGVMHRKIIDHLLFSFIILSSVVDKIQYVALMTKCSLVWYLLLTLMKLFNLWTRWSMWQFNLLLLRRLSSRLYIKYMWKKVKQELSFYILDPPLWNICRSWWRQIIHHCIFCLIKYIFIVSIDFTRYFYL